MECRILKKQALMGSLNLLHQCPELEDHDCENDQHPVNPEIVRDLLLQLYPYKSMGPDGIHRRILKELANVIAKPLPMPWRADANWLHKDFSHPFRILGCSLNRSKRTWVGVEYSCIISNFTINPG
ncbi:hypothetical protein BTVI_107649 [Pitangus sulphuratus]|nr:hypothetical protein BTVI_107649 [Pitangus sulphuratus]